MQAQTKLRATIPPEFASSIGQSPHYFGNGQMTIHLLRPAPI
jgi:hypothetical protein